MKSRGVKVRSGGVEDGRRVVGAREKEREREKKARQRGRRSAAPPHASVSLQGPPDTLPRKIVLTCQSSERP